MNTTTTQPPATGEAAHTPWNDTIIHTGMTGPTTPGLQGVTCEEYCEYADYERLSEEDKNAKRPTRRHTPIGFGATVVAIAVGENHKERAAFIVRACNSHAALVAALEEIQRTADAHPMIRVAHYVENWPKISAALALAKEA